MLTPHQNYVFRLYEKLVSKRDQGNGVHPMSHQEILSFLWIEGVDEEEEKRDLAQLLSMLEDIVVDYMRAKLEKEIEEVENKS